MSSADEVSQTISKKSKKPQYSRFTQQELPACKPILTPGLVITTLISIGIIFIPIGLSSLSASENVVEIVDRYDDACVPSTGNDEATKHDRLSFIQNEKTNKTCIRNLVVPKKMKHPIYVYYQLDNFYQNHRRYVKSRSDRQYRSPRYEGDTKTCDPESEIDYHKPIVPCGLIAWSLFNDTYGISTKSNPIPINKKDIAWGSDKKSKFGSNVYPKNFQKQDPIGGGKLNESLPLSEQEDLLVWMRTAALPNFRKLYGRIETDLEANEKIRAFGRSSLLVLESKFCSALSISNIIVFVSSSTAGNILIAVTLLSLGTQICNTEMINSATRYEYMTGLLPPGNDIAVAGKPT
ncbi:ALA-interacting subunit 5 [Forsythia ovata]|uniref:ALA-interacting subunit 5 n=1 Tax=Forsythia ovata TaxID=205694 RepID=A0ABD1X2D9_9LAMI